MADTKKPKSTILMELKGGTITIELLPDVAPEHIESMKTLAWAGVYDNVCFHRVIDGFMAQTGDVQHGNMEDEFNLRMAGIGGPEHPDFPAEFSKLPHDRGTLGAARSSNPNSATRNSSSISRTTISSTANTRSMAASSRAMDHVDPIVRGEPPAEPDRMIGVKVAANA